MTKRWIGALLLAAMMLGPSALAVTSAPEKPLDQVMPQMPKLPFDIFDSGLRPPSRQERQQDPLKYLTMDMATVTADLSNRVTGEPVQQRQASILSELDQIIKQMEQSQSKSSSSSGQGKSQTNNPSSPMTDSKITGGPGGIGDLHAPKAGTDKWGDLPPKQRDAILQSKTEGFPAGYESLLQSYYRRLAQEQVTAGGDEAPPAKAPADKPVPDKPAATPAAEGTAAP